MSIGMPPVAIFQDAHIGRHIDGPLLTWAGNLHWLTLRERWACFLGRADANSLAQRHWGRDDRIKELSTFNVLKGARHG